MNSPALPDNWADLSDDKLGEKLLTLWTHYQVTKRGIYPEDESKDVAEGLLNGTLLMDTDVAKDVSLEKALQFAALGEFTKSGSLLRGILQDKAIVVVQEELAQTGLKYRLAQSKKAKKPRGKISEDGKTINEIIGELATYKEHEGESTKELWPHFFGH